ncbi:G-protein coupled receptor, partial [Globisporangium splendens]
MRAQPKVAIKNQNWRAWSEKNEQLRDASAPEMAIDGGCCLLYRYGGAGDAPKHAGVFESNCMDSSATMYGAGAEVDADGKVTKQGKIESTLIVEPISALLGMTPLPSMRSDLVLVGHARPEERVAAVQLRWRAHGVSAATEDQLPVQVGSCRRVEMVELDQHQANVRLHVLRVQRVDPANATRSLECDLSTTTTLPDDVLVDCEYVLFSSPVFMVWAIASGVLISVLAMVFVFVCRNAPIIKRSQFELMIFGGILVCLSAIVYAGELSYVLCAARPLLISSGFTTIFGALFVKSLRVYHVFMKSAVGVLHGGPGHHRRVIWHRLSETNDDAGAGDRVSGRSGARGVPFREFHLQCAADVLEGDRAGVGYLHFVFDPERGIGFPGVDLDFLVVGDGAGGVSGDFAVGVLGGFGCSPVLRVSGRFVADLYDCGDVVHAGAEGVAFACSVDIVQLVEVPAFVTISRVTGRCH